MVYQIIITDCGILTNFRTFQDGKDALHALNSELNWHRKQYSEDEDNAEEYDAIDLEDENMVCTFLFKCGDIRVNFVAGEIE